MNILITGGSGFLGSAFSEWLNKNEDITTNITWVSRNTAQAHPDYVQMMSYDELKTTQAIFDVIINLAGAGIADKRWSEQRKQLLFDSRIKPTQSVIDYISRITPKPKLLVSGSAIGWYGVQGETILDEKSSFKDDFAHQICEKWEQKASEATDLGVQVALVRTGIVIHPGGGMLARLLLSFKLGFGGKLGDGRQIMSWISREDWVRGVWFIIQKHLFTDNAQHSDDNITHTLPKSPTIYNLTAPNPVSNSEFTKALGKWLHRPTFMTLPEPVLKLIFDEMSTLLLDGQKVIPKALLEAGFEFKHSLLMQALPQ